MRVYVVCPGATEEEPLTQNPTPRDSEMGCSAAQQLARSAVLSGGAASKGLHLAGATAVPDHAN